MTPKRMWCIIEVLNHQRKTNTFGKIFNNPIKCRMEAGGSK